MAQLADFSTEQQYEAKITASRLLTPPEVEEIREIVLEVNDPSFQCEVDKSFGVLIKADSDFGNTFHHRLYSVADLPEVAGTKPQLTMLVKRCAYIDQFSGEKYDGVASNYLCDRKVGDKITITGPFDLPFEIPEDVTTNLILVGMGTGIAPFRAFVKHIYQNVKGWEGKIRLFYGAKSGLELLYLNDEDGDLTNYYDKKTFEAFHALSPRPHMHDPIALSEVIEGRADEILKLLNEVNTRVYVAGYEGVREKLDRAFSNIMGSESAWKTRKAELIAGKKWAEIIY